MFVYFDPKIFNSFYLIQCLIQVTLSFWPRCRLRGPLNSITFDFALLTDNLLASNHLDTISNSDDSSVSIVTTSWPFTSRAVSSGWSHLPEAVKHSSAHPLNETEHDTRAIQVTETGSTSCHWSTVTIIDACTRYPEQMESCSMPKLN